MLAETRCRSEYYEALRAADGYPAATEDEPESTRSSEARSSGWEKPGVADHPDRPPPESFRIPPERAAHILDGDATGGGHRHGTGRPGKTEFPASWDDKKIMDSVLSVSRSPDSAEFQRNGRWRAAVREYAAVGEWGEEIDLLLASLRGTGQPVTTAERNELTALLKAMGLSADPVEKLNIQS
jgi:hypothetical protein